MEHIPDRESGENLQPDDLIEGLQEASTLSRDQKYDAAFCKKLAKEFFILKHLEGQDIASWDLETLEQLYEQKVLQRLLIRLKALQVSPLADQYPLDERHDMLSYCLFRVEHGAAHVETYLGHPSFPLSEEQEQELEKYERHKRNLEKYLGKQRLHTDIVKASIHFRKLKTVAAELLGCLGDDLPIEVLFDTAAMYRGLQKKWKKTSR